MGFENAQVWQPPTIACYQPVTGLEAIRREVLSILNKATAETFISLSKSILAISIDSPDALDVIVQLIFQKASNEPNFTYIYSQLCVVLFEKARNFETENQNSTFKLLLLKRCENEFLKRKTIDFTNPVARQRFIGATRFIAYLGCYHGIPEKILHECVKSFLSSKQKGKPSNTVSTSNAQMEPTLSSGYPKEDESVALDMECFCEFLKIAGPHMDTDKARNLMDQYFDRVAKILERASPEYLRQYGPGSGKFIPLSTRVRFMIRDVIELRQNHWTPLFEGQLSDRDKPWLLSDLRKEIDMTSSGELSLSRASPGPHDLRNTCHKGTESLERESDWMKLNRMGKALCSRGKDVDLFSNGESSASVATSHRSRDGGYNSSHSHNLSYVRRQTPPSAQDVSSRSVYREFDAGSNGSSGSNGSNCLWVRRAVSRPDHRPYHPHRSLVANESYSQPKAAISNGPNSAVFFEPEYLHSQHKSQCYRASSCASSTAVTPATISPDLDAMAAGRFDAKQLTSSAVPSWRPTSVKPPPPLSRQYPHHHHNNPPSVITYAEKQAPLDENKEAAKAVMSILSQTTNTQQAVGQLREKGLIPRLNKEAILKIVLLFCDGNSTGFSLDRKSKHKACQLVSVFSLANSIEGQLMTSAIHAAWPRVLQSLSSTSPKTSLAFLAARLALAELLSLEKLAEPLSAGRHHPLFLLVLQQLAQMANSNLRPGGFLTLDDSLDDGDYIPEGVVFGEDKEERRDQLIALFAASGVVLEKMLPEGNQAPSRVMALLQERGIEFFFPSLCLAAETLCPLLTAGDLSEFASHLGELSDFGPDVVHSLMSAAFERVRLAGSPAGDSDDDAMDLEEAVWKAMVTDGQLKLCVPPERQMDVLHALQVFWHDRGMPKGFVLRCFRNLYDFDLVEKATFFAWQEEVDQNYPAKGQVLFEVMRWLTWLETAELEVTSDDAGDAPDA